MQYENLINVTEEIGNPAEKIWYSPKAEYAGLVQKLTDVVNAEDIRGAVLVATDDDIIWASGTRSKDINGETVSPLTVFEIGSVTKTFTASLVFRLVEEGKLSLADRVTDYFPEYAKAEDMTVYDLLHMQSGILDFADEFEKFFDMRNKDKAFEQSFRNDEMSDGVFLENLYKLDLKFTPSSDTAYSNTNYVLLAMIIERLTGKTYKEYIEETIFEPLGMSSSSAVSVGDVTSVPEQEEGYHKAQRRARGAGDIHSTVIDMLKFDRAYFAEKIVSKDSMAAMMKLDGGYGCGWMSEGFCWWQENGEPKGSDLIFHSGSTLSYICDNIVFGVSGKRVYLIMMSPCFTDATKPIIGSCKKYLR
ncbi:MAG: beta-lactamase family protein [Oscillospiraceae bacterium]|nr:beta-lactamase family protein [Oscillospiraceae bacterium]